MVVAEGPHPLERDLERPARRRTFKLGRQIVGLSHRKLIPATALLAAVIVLAADIAGRLVVSSGEISVGIMIGFIGAPVFIGIVRRRKLAQL